MPAPRRSSTLPLLGMLFGLAAQGTATAADAMAIAFAPGAATLDTAARASLDAVAQRLAGDPALRLRLTATTAGAADEAHRLSLARARAAWAHLTSHGVQAGRITVRVAGDRAAGEPDRLDLIVERP